MILFLQSRFFDCVLECVPTFTEKKEFLDDKNKHSKNSKTNLNLSDYCETFVEKSSISCPKLLGRCLLKTLVALMKKEKRKDKIRKIKKALLWFNQN